MVWLLYLFSKGKNYRLQPSRMVLGLDILFSVRPRRGLVCNESGWTRLKAQPSGNEIDVGRRRGSCFVAYPKPTTRHPPHAAIGQECGGCQIPSQALFSIFELRVNNRAGDKWGRCLWVTHRFSRWQSGRFSPSPPHFSITSTRALWFFF